MTTEPTTADDTIGVTFSGTPDEGQHVTEATDKALLTIFGTKHPEMANGLLMHCFKVLKSNECSDDFKGNDERTFMLATVAEIKPRDAFERMLAVQMAATHVAMIRSGRWLSHADRIEQVQAHYSGYTKLARAYSMQMETLRKHRNGGKQTVRVERVTVESGGQAVVGDVSHRGDG